MTSPDTSLSHSLFLRACRGEATPRPPIWLMRQAGRYMPEYRAIREKVTFLELCTRPELAAQVTLDAQRLLGVDAAILFADLLPILMPMGLGLEYAKGEGPVIHNPIRVSEDVARVNVHDPRETQPFVRDAIGLIRRDLPPEIPLIGFAGMPFTLAAYAVEGGSSRHFETVKRFMYTQPEAWDALLSKLVAVVVPYLRMQIDAGVQAIQLFDSWVGCLSPRDYRRFVQPHSKAVIDGVRGLVPVIHFGVGSATLLPDMRDCGADVLGFDWHTPFTPLWDTLGLSAAQGNLDPITLFADRSEVLAQARAVLADVGGRPGHIFNLGHGILPGTPVDNVKALVELVKTR